MKSINLNSWVKEKDGMIIPNNWGDDINFNFLEQITKCKHIPCKIAGESENYAFIGSIIDNKRVNNNTIIWGSGISDENLKLGQKPKKVCCVRGPITKKVLEKNGIDVPPIYGDPALLLPLVYNPPIKKKYKFGIIPHYVSLKNPILKTYPEDVHVINLRNYKKWTDIIDEIKSCEIIFSESLHGLIAANAYGIPNVWIKLDYDKMTVKFHDFFLSVGKDRKVRFDINKYTYSDLQKISKYAIVTNDIDIQKIIDSCPVL